MTTFAGDSVSDKTATSGRFAVEIDGSIVATFTEVSGLEVSISTDKLEEGGGNDVTLKFPGRADYSNLTLKRGVAESTDLLDWMLGVVRGEYVRKNISIRVVRSDLSEIHSWQFKDAFPVKWSGPSLQTSGNSMAIETLELAHSGFVSI